LSDIWQQHPREATQNGSVIAATVRAHPGGIGRRRAAIVVLRMGQGYKFIH
jgi:hypothetical protein